MREGSSGKGWGWLKVLGSEEEGRDGRGEEGEEGRCKRSEPGRTSRVPKPQLPSTDTDPTTHREHKRQPVAASTPQAAHEFADQPRSRGRAIRRQPTPIHRPLMPRAARTAIRSSTARPAPTRRR